MKKRLKQLGQWIGAILIASLVMNFALSFYNRAAGWIDRTKGSTLSIYNPNSSLIMGTEGRGYHKVDSRGYVNNCDVLAENYVIAIGASYTQGKEVSDGERYTDLLNNWLGYTEEAFVYNVSQDAYYFPKIVKGFSALLQEFPDVNKIIIETGTTNFTTDSLEDALVQREYDKMQTGENIWSILSLKKKINILIKEYSPLFYNVNNKIKTIKKMNSEIPDTNSEKLDLNLYETNLNNVFDFLVSSYGGDIIILYHPSVCINQDGGLVIKINDTDEIFKRLCEEHNITLVDMSERFMQSYEYNYELPYGFSNTSLGQGHFNADGHRMIAEELIKVLK